MVEDNFSNITTLTRRTLLHTAAIAAAAPVSRAAAPARPVRVGVVGGGFGASFHWHLHPHSKVTAVCDIRPDRLQRLSELYKCGNTYKSFREMLKHPELDAVAVFTPVPMHSWMSVEAMRAGKHVICAVPVGNTVEELEKVLECVKTTGMKYMMAETSYYYAEIITCREWAREGRFGTIFYAESEYHHEGIIPLMYDDRGMPTWRLGTPPFRYPTHCTGMIIPVMQERLTEVMAIGWGDDHEVLRTNLYHNPYWNATSFFKTSKGHCCRVAVFYHVAAGGTERATFYGDRLSYSMRRPEGSPIAVTSIAKDGKTVLDANGYPQGDVKIEAFKQPDHKEKLPQSLRGKSGHGGSHPFLVHEFISAIVEDRHPAVNIWEAIAYTLPGIVAEKSALRGGELLKIKDYGNAPA